jgi:hypothetical protein
MPSFDDEETLVNPLGVRFPTREVARQVVPLVKEDILRCPKCGSSETRTFHMAWQLYGTAAGRPGLAGVTPPPEMPAFPTTIMKWGLCVCLSLLIGLAAFGVVTGANQTVSPDIVLFFVTAPLFLATLIVSTKVYDKWDSGVRQRETATYNAARNEWLLKCICLRCGEIWKRQEGGGSA